MRCGLLAFFNIASAFAYQKIYKYIHMNGMYMSPSFHPGAELEIGFWRGANVSQRVTFDLLVGLFLSLKLKS